jgi:hypothetical protein
MSDMGGGKDIGGLWDAQAAKVQGARQADRAKAFQRTRMAPAVSHERDEVRTIQPKTYIARPMGPRKPQLSAAARSLTGGKR